MFDSIATLFSAPIITRSYQARPSLMNHCKKTAVVRYGHVQKTIDKESQDILESLTRPVETWIIQKSPHLKCMALNIAIFDIITNKAKPGTLSVHSNNNNANNKSAIVHNLFVLIVQYKILNEKIMEMSTGALQIFINGLCGIYLESNGPLDELTCLLHFIVNSCKVHESDNLKGNLSLFRPLDLSRLDHFFKVYSNILQSDKTCFIDLVVNIIPMMTELCKIIVKTDRTSEKLVLLKRIAWLGQIGILIIRTIQKDVEDVVAGRQEIGQQQTMNPSLRKRLFDKGTQLLQIQGIITGKVLFSYAYKQLYFFQHSLKLHKYMMEIALESQQLSSQLQKINIQLVKVLLKAINEYQFNLPDTSIQYLGSILSVSLFETEEEDKDIFPEMRSCELQEFIQDLKCCPQYQINYSQNDVLPQGESEEFDYYLEKDDSIVSSILYMVFNLKLEYLEILKIILTKTEPRYLENLQFYLIKNGLLHFLIEELQSIQSNDKKLLDNYFKVLGLLLQRNTIAYCLVNEIISRQIEQNEKSALVEYIRKHFVHAKQFLLVLLSDTITINSKKSTLSYFIPKPLHALLYNTANTPPKHDIWISYIHDVVLRQLRIKRQKQKGKRQFFDKEMNEWTMLAIMIQIEHMLYQKGSDIELGQFTMSYLTNILKEAIKWKQEETETMRRLLKTYEEWETYYSGVIMETDHAIDIIEEKWGPTISFLYLRRWNKKICNSIRLFIESVTTFKGNQDLF